MTDLKTCLKCSRIGSYYGFIRGMIITNTFWLCAIIIFIGVMSAGCL